MGIKVYGENDQSFPEKIILYYEFVWLKKDYYKSPYSEWLTKRDLELVT